MCDAIDPKEEKFRLISSVFYVGGDGLGLVLFLSKMEILCRLIHSVENVHTIFPDVDMDLVLIS